MTDHTDPAEPDSGSTPPPPTAPPPSAAPPPTAAPPPGTARRFRRGDGPLGGVAVGLAHLTGLDLTLVRVILVVGALFAPVIVPLYVAAWVLVPTTADTDPRPFRITGATPAVVVGVFLVFAAVASLGDNVGPFGSGDGSSFLVAAALVAGGIYLLNQRETPAPSPYPPAPSPPAPAPAPAWAVPRVEPSGAAFATEPAPPQPSPPLTSIALGTALLVSCVLLALSQAFDWGLGAGTVLGVITLCCGIGLAVSAFVGRCIPLALIGFTALTLQVAAPALDTVAGGSVGTVRDNPQTAALVERHYEISAGELILDLRPALADGATSRLPVEVDIGAGYAEIIVPAEATIVVDAGSRFGYVDVLGERREGIGVSLNRRANPIESTDSEAFSEGTAADGPTVVIDAQVTFGYIEVRRG